MPNSFCIFEQRYKDVIVNNGIFEVIVSENNGKTDKHFPTKTEIITYTKHEGGRNRSLLEKMVHDQQHAKYVTQITSFYLHYYTLFYRYTKSRQSKLSI